MAISPIQLTLAIVVLLSFAPHGTPSSSSPLLSELKTLQSNSPSGVIHLSDTLLRRILSLPKPRPFHFLVFFDAQHLHSKSELSLPKLKSEFSLVSSSFLKNNNNPNHQIKSSSLFFFELEFQESQASFSLFSVNSLPHIRLVPPFAIDMKSDSIQMDAGDYSRLADSMAEFIESRAKLSVGPISRPPLISRNQVVLLGVLVLASIPFFVRRVVAGNTFLHDKGVWMAGAVFVYFFSVSGAMFNIIRKMPMFMMDRQDPDKLVFFYQGSGMQLGAEGFAVGFLYTIVGLLLAFMTHVLVRVRNRTVQRVMMVVALIVSFWAVKKVVSLDNWKTGYGIHAYWPSRWE